MSEHKQILYSKETLVATVTLNGPAVAGGLTLAVACDFRIAAASAKLGDTSLRFAHEFAVAAF